jgi:hypothetical protein
LVSYFQSSKALRSCTKLGVQALKFKLRVLVNLTKISKPSLGERMVTAWHVRCQTSFGGELFLREFNGILNCGVMSLKLGLAASMPKCSQIKAPSVEKCLN